MHMKFVIIRDAACISDALASWKYSHDEDVRKDSHHVFKYLVFNLQIDCGASVRHTLLYSCKLQANKSGFSHSE